LNIDGSLDMTFDPGSGFNNPVFSVVQQSDGEILVGGAFRQYNGASVGGIVRLNLDGSLDTTFNPGGSGQIRQLKQSFCSRTAGFWSADFSSLLTARRLLWDLFA
jgi:hypothetical protein